MVESISPTFNECMSLLKDADTAIDIANSKFGKDIGYLFACMYCGKYPLDKSLSQC
jgi:hypothetical protein